MTKKFVLSNFTDSTTEKEKKNAGAKRPIWYEESTEKVKRLYDLILIEFKRIKRAIKSGEKLSITERRIVASRISKKANVDKSYLTKRSNPQLILIIERKNSKLERLWKSYFHSKSDRNMTKKELEKKCKQLTNELKAERNQNISESISEALKTELTVTKGKLSHQIKTLEIKNRTLNGENIEFRAKIIQHGKTIDRLVSEKIENNSLIQKHQKLILELQTKLKTICS